MHELHRGPTRSRVPKILFLAIGGVGLAYTVALLLGGEPSVSASISGQLTAASWGERVPSAAVALDTANQPESESERRTAPPTPGEESSPPYVRTREDIADDWYFLDEIRSKLSREAFAAAQGIASESDFMTLTVGAKLHATMAQCLLEGSYLEADVARATVPDPEQLVLDCRLLHFDSRLLHKEQSRSHNANARPSQVRPAPRILIDLRKHRDLAHDLRELPRHQGPKKAGSNPTLQAIADELLEVGYAVMVR